MKRSYEAYDWWPYRDRPKVRWPGDKRIAVWVAPNIEFYEFNPPHNPSRKAWPRPFPDNEAYASRDYGNRVGHWRLMDLLDHFGIRGSISLSVGLLQHHPEIAKACLERNWEFYSHGIYNTRFTYGMSEAEEREMIRDSIDSVQQATGQRIAGWLSPALTYSEQTMELISEMGLTYTCDLFHDDQVTPVKTEKGQLCSVPYSLEFNDSIVFQSNQLPPRRYVQTLKKGFDRLYQEGEESGTVMCIPLHAYLISHPHRMECFKEIFEYISKHDGVWFTTGREIADHWRANYWEASVADIASKNAA